MKNIVIGGLVGIVIMIVVGIPMVCVLCIEWEPVVSEETYLTTDDYWELKHLIEYQKQNSKLEIATIKENHLKSIKQYETDIGVWVDKAVELQKIIRHYEDTDVKIEESGVEKPVSLVDIIKQVKPGVVHIMCPQWQGSGFVVGSNLIMTARHCVEGVEDFNITTQDGHKLHATRAISSKDHDIAFIYIDDLICSRQAFEKGTCEDKSHEVKLNILELGSIKDCQLGQQVFVVGSPYGKVNFNAVSLGIISGLDVDWSPLGEDYGWEIAFTTDSAGHPGNSGGPVFTLDGKVRGILVGGFSPVLISVMPCDLFLDDIDEIEFMFKQDEYQKEVAPVYNPNDWMAADGTEYY